MTALFPIKRSEKLTFNYFISRGHGKFKNTSELCMTRTQEKYDGKWS